MSCIYFLDIPCISLDIHGISTIKHMYGISKDIPCIYHTYTIHMDGDTICMVYTIHIPGIYQKLGFQKFIPLASQKACNITKVGSAYICQICRIWTVHYSAYCFWGLHIILHILHIDFWGLHIILHIVHIG